MSVSDGCTCDSHEDILADTLVHRRTHTYLLERDWTLVVQLFDIMIINLFVCEKDVG